MSTSSSTTESPRPPVVLSSNRTVSTSAPCMPHIRDLVAEDLGIAPAHRQRDLWEVLDQPDQIIPMTGPTSHPRQSPWGRCDHIEVIAPGMVRVHTAGHGGIHLDSWRTKMLPPAFRRSAQQWFEEDWACAISMVAFHREFTEREVWSEMSATSVSIDPDQER